MGASVGGGAGTEWVFCSFCHHRCWVSASWIDVESLPRCGCVCARWEALGSKLTVFHGFTCSGWRSGIFNRFRQVNFRQYSLDYLDYVLCVDFQTGVFALYSVETGWCEEAPVKGFRWSPCPSVHDNFLLFPLQDDSSSHACWDRPGLCGAEEDRGPRL